MSAYEINKALTKNFQVMIGPSTIYSKLSTLEESGDICRTQSRSGKEYSLTEQGHETINDIPAIIAEILKSAKELLEGQNGHEKRRRQIP